MSVQRLSQSLLITVLVLCPGDVVGQFTAALPACPYGTFTFSCTVYGNMSGVSTWRMGGSTECTLLHTSTFSSICGQNDAFMARPGTGFGTNTTFFTSTLRGNANPALDGTLVECFGPGNNVNPENRVGNSTLQILGPPSVPILYCVQLTEDVSETVNITVNWTLSGGDSADFYLINITTNAPQIPYGGLLNITTTNVTQYELTGFMVGYEYNITVRGVNCGSQEGSESEPLTIRPQIPVAPRSCNITLFYNQSSRKLKFINTIWDSMPDLVDPQEACQGPRGRIIGYQIKFQIGSSVDREKVNITTCLAGRCNHNSNLLGDSVPSSYDRVSVAAENVVGVGAARNCTTQTISRTNNLLSGELVDKNSPNDATFVCTFLCEFNGSAPCQVQYGSDPTYINLPYSAKSTETGTAGNSRRVVLRERLNSSMAYYYTVSTVVGNVTVTILGNFTTPQYKCDEVDLTDENGTANPARCADRGLANSSVISDGVVCYNGTTIGSKAVYLCNSGFLLVGNEARVCQDDVSWSGSMPQCIPATDQINPIAGGVVGGVIVLLIVITIVIVVIVVRVEHKRRHLAEKKRRTEELATKENLHKAAENGNIDVVKHHLEVNNVDINSTNSKGVTPLHNAARRGHKDIVEYLVDKNATINIQDKEKRTALHMAAEGGHEGTVKYLVEGGAEINIKDNEGWTPLHVAAERGTLATVECLVDKGANIHIEDGFERTPLHIAARRGHRKIVKYLAKIGADTKSKDRFGWTPMHNAVKRSQNRIVKYLAGSQVDVNTKDNENRTPLHMAAEGGDKNIVEHLLNGKADVKSKDKNGRTPLHIAARHGHKDIVEYLVGEVPDIDVNCEDYKKQTPLHLAAREGHEQTVKCLVAKGADCVVNSQDKEGRTPLYMAAKGGCLEIIKCLVDLNADINIKDRAMRSPLDIAEEKGHADIVEYLGGKEETSM